MCSTALSFFVLCSRQEIAGSTMSSVASGSVSAAPDYDPMNDPRRKPKSKDPGWKYGYWPEIGNRDKVMCILCNTVTKGGIKRLKEHLADGYSDELICPKTTTEIRKEMGDYLKNNKRTRPICLDDDDDEVVAHEVVS